MDEKWILIVDDQEPILSVLKSSLKLPGANYQVATASSGQEAIDWLRRRSFDLMVTDYKMAGMDGLELLRTARILRPKIRTILMTAYGSPQLEREARRLDTFRYLSKPLEIDVFRRIVQEALGDRASSQRGVLVLSDTQYIEITRILEQLRRDTGARCILLTSAEGHQLIHVGETNRLPMQEIAALLGGGIASLIEAGRVIDGGDDCTNLAFREGKQEDLYASNIGHEMLLVSVTLHQANNRLGAQWHYTQQAAMHIRQRLERGRSKEAVQASPAEGLEQALDQEMDRLFPASLPPDPAVVQRAREAAAGKQVE